MQSPTISEEEALRDARRRAEVAEAELSRLKQNSQAQTISAEGSDKLEGEAALRKDSMMAHLLDSLAHGKDIGHYGRLVFAMVARHFLAQEEVVSWLTRDPDFTEAAATDMLSQVEQRDYNPPRRERLLEWQQEQEFPILPEPNDPDCGNLYRNLKFPDSLYDHINDYQAHKSR